MNNSNLVEVTMKTVDTIIFRVISEIRGKWKHPDEARIMISLKTFQAIVPYPMAPLGKEWKDLRTKELL